MVRSSSGRRMPEGRGRGQGSAGQGARRGWGGGGGRVLASMALLALAPACAPGEASYEARLLTDMCTDTPPLEGVHYLRFRLTREGLAPVERYVPVERGAEEVPRVPAGKGWVLEVRGYTAMPGVGGRVVAVGRSRPFEVPESSGAGRPMVSVALRRVGTYSRPRSAQGGCLSLGMPRAAHTATLLADGRVLLAGGYGLNQSGVRTVLSSVELFDPVMGTLEAGPALGVGAGTSFQASPRAFHTATRLPDGKVLLAGGEAGEGVTPVGQALLLDVAQRTYEGVSLGVARSRHAAAMDEGGRVLWVGGVGAAGAVVREAEGYDSGSGRTFAVSTPVPRWGMGAAPVQGGRRLAVAGGSDGSMLRPEVLLFEYAGGTFAPVATAARLREPRSDAALVAFGGPEQLLLVGGYDAFDNVESSRRLLASSERVDAGAPGQASTAGPQVFARSGLCAVALPDGRVLTVGGQQASGMGLESSRRVELLHPGREGEAPTTLGVPMLARGRYQHTCTALQDGSVLIAGGVEDDGRQKTVLGELLLYTPAPLD